MPTAHSCALLPKPGVSITPIFFDPYLAIHTSDVEPLPHQISAVYQEMLGRIPLRYVLADDPGAGKTIMTGLFIKELIARSDLKRCLIVSPGSLAEQWQDELYRKFHLRFEILTNDRIESAVTGNAFEEVDLAIAHLDKLARNEAIQEKLRVTDWDLIVCDEAHKMSATVWSGEVKMTRRFSAWTAAFRHYPPLPSAHGNAAQRQGGRFSAFPFSGGSGSFWRRGPYRRTGRKRLRCDATTGEGGLAQV
mgnify:CR=1 FL=1